MFSKSWKGRAGNLSQSDLAVLDLLLEAYPNYCMVDDYSAVKKLLERDMIEANVRKDGDADQPVYRITRLGAQVYGSCGAAPQLDRVG